MSAITEEQICSELMAYVRNYIVDAAAEVRADTPFKELGFDSVNMIDLVLFIERKFKVPIPDRDLIPGNLYSISALAKCTMKYL